MEDDAEVALHLGEDRHVNICGGRPDHADHLELACSAAFVSDEGSPGADVGGVSPVPAQMWAG